MALEGIGVLFEGARTEEEDEADGSKSDPDAFKGAPTFAGKGLRVPWKESTGAKISEVGDRGRVVVGTPDISDGPVERGSIDVGATVGRGVACC